MDLYFNDEFVVSTRILFSDYEGLQTLVVLPDSIGILCFVMMIALCWCFSHQRT